MRVYITVMPHPDDITIKLHRGGIFVANKNRYMPGPVGATCWGLVESLRLSLCVPQKEKRSKAFVSIVVKKARPEGEKESRRLSTNPHPPEAGECARTIILQSLTALQPGCEANLPSHRACVSGEAYHQAPALRQVYSGCCN